jgi:hypothetical protein
MYFHTYVCRAVQEGAALPDPAKVKLKTRERFSIDADNSTAADT